MRLKLIAVTALVTCATLTSAWAATSKTIAALYQEKAQLKGQQIQVKGKVVKVTNGVMQKNFLHIQDGSGSKGTNDLTVTSDDTAVIGDEVTVTGTVSLDRDFGAGYIFPLLLEQATIGKGK